MDYEENLRVIKERIASACLRAGRPVDSVSLMGVTKGQPAQAISAMAALGVKLFGENKVQEAKAKLPGVAPTDSKFVGTVAALNVHHVIKQIRQQSPVLRALIDSGKLSVVGGIQDLNTGKVEFFKP